MSYTAILILFAFFLLSSCTWGLQEEMRKDSNSDISAEETIKPTEITPEFEEILEKLNHYYGTVTEEGYKNTLYGYEFNYPWHFFYLIEDGTAYEDYEKSAHIELWWILPPDGEGHTQTKIKVRSRKIEEIPEWYLVRDNGEYQVIYKKTPDIRQHNSSNMLSRVVLVYLPDEELQLMFSIQAFKFNDDGSNTDKEIEQRALEIQEAILNTLDFDVKTFVSAARSIGF